MRVLEKPWTAPRPAARLSPTDWERFLNPEPPPVVKPNAPGSSAPEPKKAWTILYYGACDNDLRHEMYDDINEMEQTGSTPSLHVVTQMDMGGYTGACRRYVVRDNAPDKVTSPVVQTLGDVNMADPRQLQDFIVWGMRQYPAEHYMLVVGSHGMAWEGVVQDDGHGATMTLATLGDALQAARAQTGRKLDVLGFDACLMSSAEATQALKDAADVMVASEETEAGDGWPWQSFLAGAAAGGQRSGLDMARDLVRLARHTPDTLPTMAAVDLRQVPGLTDAVRNLASAIVDTETSSKTLRVLARDTVKLTMVRDLGDFAARVATSDRIHDARLKDAAREVVQAVSRMVVVETHTSDYHGAMGLSINLPGYFFSPPERYSETDFAKATGWDKALSKMGERWWWPWSI